MTSKSKSIQIMPARGRAITAALGGQRDGEGQAAAEGNSMRKFVFANLVFGTLGLTVFASAALSFAVAHEGHQMQCNEPAINAINADIQSMNDGEAKTAAMKEMQMAEDMMAKKDTDGCMAHMHNAMEATEK